MFSELKRSSRSPHPDSTFYKVGKQSLVIANVYRCLLSASLRAFKPFILSHLQNNSGSSMFHFKDGEIEA